MSNEGFYKWACGFHKTYTKRGGKFSCDLEGTKRHPRCPVCGIPMINMGKQFQPPKKSNKKRWDRIKKIHLKKIEGKKNV